MRAVQRLKLPIQRREIFDSILSTIKGVQRLQRAQRLKTFNLVIVAIKPEEIRRLDRFEGRNAVFSTVKCRKLLQFPQGFQASELVIVAVDGATNEDETDGITAAVCRNPSTSAKGSFYSKLEKDGCWALELHESDRQKHHRGGFDQFGQRLTLALSTNTFAGTRNSRFCFSRIFRAGGRNG